MDRIIALSKPNRHLPHDSVEMQSPPPPDALTDEMARKNAAAIVGRLMRGVSGDDPDPDPRAPSRAGPGVDVADPPALTASRAAAPATTPARTPPAAAGPATHRPRAAASRTEPEAAALRAALRASWQNDRTNAGRGAVFGWRHPVHTGIAAVLRAAVLWPVLVAVLALGLIGAAAPAIPSGIRRPRRF